MPRVTRRSRHATCSHVSQAAAPKPGVSGDSPSLGKLAKQGVAIGLLRAGALEILLFPTAMVTARLLTPTEFGITTAAMFFIQLSTRLSDLGFTAALVRAKHITEEHLSTVFVMNILIAVAAYASLTAIAPFVGMFYGVPETGQILPVAAVSFLLMPIGAIPNALIDRGMRFRQGLLIDCYQSLTFAVLSMLLAWQGFSFWSLIYARVAAVAVQALSQYWFAPWRPSLKFSWTALREVLSFAAGVHTKRLLEYTAANVDNLVIGRWMGVTALGLYDKAFSTMNRLLVRMSVGGPNVMFRIFSMMQEDPERFRRAYAKVIMSAGLFAFPAFATLAALGPYVIVLLFGDQWVEAVQPFQILCLAGALKLLNSYAGAAAQATGRIWPEVWRHVGYTALIILGLYVLRERGPVGAAFAVLGATAVMFIMMHTLLRQVTHLSWVEIFRPQWPAIVCAVLTAGAALLVESLVAQGADPRSWREFAAASSAALICYVAFMLFAPIRDLRALVEEISADMLPERVKRQRWVNWYLALNARSAQ
jgi:teichuronic acid exporter